MSSNLVQVEIIQTPVAVVEILSAQVSVEVIQQVVEVTEIVQQGIPGPAGSNSNDPWEEDSFALIEDQTEFVLSKIPRVGSIQMYTNGLREDLSNFSFLGNIVTVSGFTPTEDDNITFIYQEE